MPVDHRATVQGVSARNLDLQTTMRAPRNRRCDNARPHAKRIEALKKLPQ